MVNGLPSSEKEREFLDEEPTIVIVVGGGKSGLDVVARLKMLGINALVVERNQRVGNNWRERYAALCLHDPVWYDHIPYLPFPPSWPVYTPALKLVDWLESYAHSLELNVWTSATVASIQRETGDSGKRWVVQVRKMAIGGLPHRPVWSPDYPVPWVHECCQSRSNQILRNDEKDR
ncbi:hypothetical protein HD554DRAFT_2035056 [Boletus coccyginus]|nr:hypothetical protein HD554DRAFT_2035056 [Boletus coccyginus]